MMYKMLSDAGDKVPELKIGNTAIWYQKPIRGRMFTTGHIDPENLEATHSLLGTIAETDLERIFAVMQGDHWSPKGEARDLIESAGLGHTSMSVGDVVVRDGQVFVVANMGFMRLPEGSYV